LWNTFFKELGAEVILSPKTTKDILAASVKYAVNDACLPVKLFHGHASYLADKADYIFIPRLKSVAKKEYICPKISGLPEMVKFSVPNLPEIIDTEVNLRKSKRNLNKAFFEAGSFVTEDKSCIKQAAHKAIESHKNYVSALRKGRLPGELLENTKPPKAENADISVALLGHSYNLYDEYSNINILKKLAEHNAEVLTPETIEETLIDLYSLKIGKRMFWTLGKRQLGALFQFLENKVDGIIYVMAFGCGIDSFIADLAERYAKRSKIPFYLMVLDEHSGEAGINTRIEAFVDMIRWKKKDEDYCSAFR
jgi:predicted nucleotide-binding protein (sugar kinase/HSP70/actin superfamily)